MILVNFILCTKPNNKDSISNIQIYNSTLPKTTDNILNIFYRTGLTSLLINKYIHILQYLHVISFWVTLNWMQFDWFWQTPDSTVNTQTVLVI